MEMKINQFTKCSQSNITQLNSHSYAKISVTVISFSMHHFQSCCQASSLLMTISLCSEGHFEYVETSIIKCTMDFNGISPKQSSIISDLT